ncbi:DNA repair and recombination protein pif1, mitochondrial [Tetrabaena socialis]|uniref:ATP-dependent DNA helicase n=1 Tax=Tetrabaena socialis TaxID=47790 RepID=A0A2J7ZPK0_9CHLO|nr:DNA repair and recombination protein pif1, mitochondrial [Tetrabaena socialis]|eukprot:PNH02181.1 DNA repair and recombination protein pif1, mitochondrial [Tetrabaena socialis]
MLARFLPVVGPAAPGPRTRPPLRRVAFAPAVQPRRVSCHISRAYESASTAQAARPKRRSSSRQSTPDPEAELEPSANIPEAELEPSANAPEAELEPSANTPETELDPSANTPAAELEPSANTPEAGLEPPAEGPAPPEPARSGPEPAQPQAPAFTPSPEQQRAINAVLEGRNLFLTGCAGTGKSATFSALRKELVRKYGSKEEFERRVAVVAMTGLASTLVGGVTIHSLLKLKCLATFEDLTNMTQNRDVIALLYDLETLMVDEAGMMSAELLQGLDAGLTVARMEKARRHAQANEFNECQWKSLRTAAQSAGSAGEAEAEDELWAEK